MISKSYILRYILKLYDIKYIFETTLEYLLELTKPSGPVISFIAKYYYVFNIKKSVQVFNFFFS